MIVAQLLPSMRRAGAESAVALICKGLVCAGVDVHLVILGGRFDYHEELADHKINIHFLRLFDGPVKFYRADIKWTIRKQAFTLLRHLQPDILHCHLSHALIWTAPAAAKFGLKTFYTVHSIDPTMNSWGIKSWWRKKEFVRAVKLSHCQLLAVSGSAARHMERGLGLARYSIPIQPNPVDLKSWKPSPSPHLRKIVMVGTLYPLKRVHVGIQAFKILSSNDPNIKLEVIGDGPERSRLEELVRSLELEARISFLGVRRDVPYLLTKAGVLWLLSEREGMPMVMLEAMASGVPVIAADRPGVNEFIRDSENGLLVPLDDPQAVAAATRRLLAETDLRERLREHGLAFVRQFSLENVVRQHLNYYIN